jgi:hypothetical protein
MKQATEDMVVVKTFEKRNFVDIWMVTPFRGYKWSLSGEESVVALGVEFKKDPYNPFNTSYQVDWLEINEGLHAYVDGVRLAKGDHIMIIPKGAYYVDNGYEIVATRMRFAKAPNIFYWFGMTWAKIKNLW